jgi:MoaA/NifB/PqqE/SkfB family radical SAM enzyme
VNHILFPITYKCNLSCEFCISKGNQEVDLEVGLKSIKSKSGEVEWVYVTGGEPFLLGDQLFEVCDKIRSYGFKVGVTTNGTFFKPEIADHVDRLGVSLDGDKEYHDAYRGIGVYDKAVSLINAVKGKCETVVMSVYFGKNEEALLKLKTKIPEIDPTYWQIQRDMFNTRLVIPDTLK